MYHYLVGIFRYERCLQDNATNKTVAPFLFGVPCEAKENNGATVDLNVFGFANICPVPWRMGIPQVVMSMTFISPRRRSDRAPQGSPLVRGKS